MLNKLVNKTIYTVSDINKQARTTLETQIGNVYITGECSSIKVYQSSGHWYLSLKDEHAQISCVMYKYQNQKLDHIPKVGDKLLVKGYITVYETRGSYQLIIDELQQEGIGKLYLAFEAMKAKLKKQGLFDQQHKKPIPKWINHVGIITSASGSVICDILTVLKRRAPTILVSVIPSLVQGKLAKKDLIKAIHIGERVKDIDVLILARGGGSIEDLWCFNEEDLAQAIYQCSKPIISAVGHETDYSIADFTADLRAATPSVAAEIISSGMANLVDLLAEYKARLIRIINNELKLVKSQLTTLIHKFNMFIRVIRDNNQKLDELAIKMRDAVYNKLRHYDHKINCLEKRLINLDPKNKLLSTSKDLQMLKNKLNWLITNKIERAKLLLRNSVAKLNAVSPLAVMTRGYSIVKKQDTIITSSSQVKIGDDINITLCNGALDCEIKNIF